MTVHVIGFRDNQDEYPNIINTTTSSQTWSRGLSPMLIGPVQHRGKIFAANVENAWQFTKVYPQHATDAGPTVEFHNWSAKGRMDSWAHRYPMGKGAIPLYSFLDGTRLDYIQARKRIYKPFYTETVKNTAAYDTLKAVYHLHGEITLLDYDGYDYRKLGMTLEDVINNPKRKMGHAFVLAMMLE